MNMDEILRAVLLPMGLGTCIRMIQNNYGRSNKTLDFSLGISAGVMVGLTEYVYSGNSDKALEYALVVSGSYALGALGGDYFPYFKYKFEKKKDIHDLFLDNKIEDMKRSKNTMDFEKLFDEGLEYIDKKSLGKTYLRKRELKNQFFSASKLAWIFNCVHSIYTDKKDNIMIHSGKKDKSVIIIFHGGVFAKDSECPEYFNIASLSENAVSIFNYPNCDEIETRTVGTFEKAHMIVEDYSIYSNIFITRSEGEISKDLARASSYIKMISNEHNTNLL